VLFDLDRRPPRLEPRLPVGAPLLGQALPLDEGPWRLRLLSGTEGTARLALRWSGPANPVKIEMKAAEASPALTLAPGATGILAWPLVAGYDSVTLSAEAAGESAPAEGSLTLEKLDLVSDEVAKR